MRAAQRLARLALACVHKEYPNKISHVLSGNEDVKPPRELTPAFFGCYDWHSAVHGHWEHYEGGHWLGTFAVYLVTGRGLAVASTGPAPGR